MGESVYYPGRSTPLCFLPGMVGILYCNIHPDFLFILCNWRFEMVGRGPWFNPHLSPHLHAIQTVVGGSAPQRIMGAVRYSHNGYFAKCIIWVFSQFRAK